MQKYKSIAKSFEHKEEKTNREREMKRAATRDSDSDEDSSSSFMAEVDLNCYYASQEENYSIEDFIDNLQAERYSYSHEESPIEEESPYFSAYSSCNSSLERINAQYMAAMNCQVPRLDSPQTIRFDSVIRVKFFNDENPVAELIHAQQYTTTYQPYQQTSDEDHP